MEITLAKIIDAHKALDALGKSDRKIPTRTAFRIAEIMEALGEKIRIFEKQRNELLAEFGTPNPDKPGAFKFDVGEAQKFEAELVELTETETEIEVKKMKLEDLGKEKIEMTALVGLTWILETE